MTVTLKLATSTIVAADVAKKAEALLAQAYKESNRGKDTVEYAIVYDAKAPSLEAYRAVGEQLIHTRGNQAECYAAYLLAINLGVPQDIAYAAYLICINS